MTSISALPLSVGNRAEKRLILERRVLTQFTDGRSEEQKYRMSQQQRQHGKSNSPMHSSPGRLLFRHSAVISSGHENAGRVSQDDKEWRQHQQGQLTAHQVVDRQTAAFVRNVGKGEAGLTPPHELPAGAYTVVITAGEEALKVPVSIAVRQDASITIVVKDDKLAVQ